MHIMVTEREDSMAPEEIKEIRDSLGESQPQFAARLGVTERTVSRWETGASEPSPLARRALERIRKEAA